MSKIFKLIGFFNEHHPQAGYNLSECNLTEYEDKTQILQYLNPENSCWLAITMNPTYSKHSLSVGETLKEGTAVFTDGFWIWPSYMVSYFRMHSIELDKEFTQYIRKNHYKLEAISQERKNLAFNFYIQIKKFGFNTKKMYFSDNLNSKLSTLRDLSTRRPLLTRESIELAFLEKIQAADNLETLQSLENELNNTPTDADLITRLLRNVSEKKAFY